MGTIQFGTDGWRGLLGIEMNPASVSQVAAAFAIYLHDLAGRVSKPALCIIGFDGRDQSLEFATIFAHILSATSIPVLLSDRVIPTPVVSYYTLKTNALAGVMITASHNPPAYNGIKFKAAYGGPFLTEETHQVELYLEKIKSIKKSIHRIETVNMVKEYCQALSQRIDLAQIGRLPFPVAIDSMAGAGQLILQDILQSYGVKTYTLDGTSQKNFNGRLPEPIAQNLYPLAGFLSQNPEYGIGIATDGDADRLGVLQNGGQWCSAQETILMLTDYVVTQRHIPGAIIKTSSVTDKIRAFFDAPTHPVIEVHVGFKYICEEMIRQPVAIGCEESGGYGYGFHLPERDGILSALLLLEMLAMNNVNNLAEYRESLNKQFGSIYYDRIDWHYDRNDRTEVLPRLYQKPPKIIGNWKIMDIKSYNSSHGIVNGLKFRFEGECRWLLIRASETEPLIRFYAEGNTNQEVDNLLNLGKHLFTCKEQA